MPSAVEKFALKVSVIIPTYNRARYLREALDSVFNQSLSPWEVIVVDDGSTDGTPDVIKAYGSRLRYVQHEQNMGISTARNSGLNAAQGDIIAWLDSDDLWEPDFLTAVVPLLAPNNRFDGAYTGLTMIDADGTKLNVSTRTEPPGELYEALIRDCFVVTPSIVMRKACYDQVGGFDPQFHISEDYDMWLRLSRQYSIVGIPLPLVRIRTHTSNTMADIDTLCKSRLMLTEKHFGKLAESASDLADTSRFAYGFAFRSMGLKYVGVGQSEKGWRFLQQAVALHPAILDRLDTFYELACGDQPRGYRGKADMLDIAANGQEMLRRLDALFADAPRSVLTLRRVAYGNAYVALGMLSDQAGLWDQARRYILQAFRANPRLLLSHRVLRRLIKLCMGKMLVSAIRRKNP